MTALQYINNFNNKPIGLYTHEVKFSNGLKTLL